MRTLAAHLCGGILRVVSCCAATRQRIRWGIGVLVLAALAAPAEAAIITISTPAGSTGLGGLPIDADATFTTATDTLTVVLRNLQTDIQTLSQNLNGLLFTVSTGQNTGSLTSSFGLERKIKANGTFTDNGNVDTGWSLSTQGAQLALNQIGSVAAPTHTIVGPANGSTYPDAKPSIAGAKLFNPFLAESATFVLHVPGVSERSTVTSATFTFGYTNCFSSVTVPLPEPGTFVMAGMAGVGFLIIGARSYQRRTKPA